MKKPWRPLALAVVLHVAGGIATAAAQTVYVRKAPAGADVEVVLNGTSVGTATADAAGDAVLPLNLSAQVGAGEMDALIAVDVCGDVRRVQIVERGMRPPAPAAGCDRREIQGVFVMRRATSLVVNAGEATPTLLLVQGAYSLRDPGPRRAWSRSPRGLVLFGGGGFSRAGDAVSNACGNLSDCSGDSTTTGVTAGAAFWITPFLAAEGSYVRPSRADVQGSGGTFRFDSFFEAHLVTITGNVGVPIGPVRLYGKGGTNYQESTFSTTQSHDAATVVIDGVPQTIEGSTQTFAVKTTGWGWLFGGGMEAWINPSFGLYVEASRVRLKGQAVEAEGESSEALTTLFAGVRIRIGR